MPINPSIAMSFRPTTELDLRPSNNLQQYGQMMAIQGAQNQNALAQYQLEAAKRQDLAQNALAAAYQKGINPETGAVDNALILRSLAESGAGHMIPDVQAKLFKSQQEQAGLKKTTAETVGLEFKNRIDKANKAITDISALNSPAEAIASIDQHLAVGDIDQQKADLLKSQLQAAPSFSAWQKGMVVGILNAKDRLMHEETARHNLQTEATAAEQLKVAQGNLGVSQGQLQLAKEQAVKPVFNAAAGGFVAPPTAANPQGTFTPVKGIQETKDQEAAVKALRSAGYDPTTGEDNISKLIEKSTSGGLEAMTSGTLAFFGKTTEGRKAISALAGTANQIATDLAGGKLGAGISNTDRDFIVSALGDVANPSKTADERLAGWNAAKDRMLRAGLIPPPKSAVAAAPTAAGPKVGTVQDGYRFKGGNPADPSSWEKQ